MTPPSKAKREQEREKERKSYPKNQPNRPRWHPGTPGGNHRRFHARTHQETVGETEVQIAPPSGLHPANGKPPRSGEGGAAALTLCYDKYIFLFVLLIRYLTPTNQGTCHRPARTIDRENSAREPQALFANANVMMSILYARCYKNIRALVRIVKINMDIFILYIFYIFLLCIYFK